MPRFEGQGGCRLWPAEAADEVHEPGWDLLDRLRDAGFTDASVHSTRFDEPGYPGTGNMIFSAAA